MVANPPADGGNWRTLIICPVSLVGQWKEEIESRIKKLHRPSVYIYHGPKRIRDPEVLSKFDVVITTYTTLTKEYPKILRDDESYAAQKKAKLPVPRREPGPLYQCDWHRAVLDESQQIKNRRTEGFAAAYNLPVSIRWCLTGTPIQNSVDDIYSLFVFTRYRFLPKMSYKLWNDTWKKKLESTDSSIRARAFKRFQPVVAAVTLRRTKKDTIEGKELISLPPRTMEVKETDFRMANEALGYQKLKDDSHSEINRLKSSAGGLRKNYTGIMLLLLRLRQACCHPFLAEYAASKQRGQNGAGDTTFVSQYTVTELDGAQLLIDSGISGLDRLTEAVKDFVLGALAPPKPGNPLPPSELDVVHCVGCKQFVMCSLSWVHSAAGIFCQTCCSFVRSNPALGITTENDPFLALDDIRREVHVRVRAARAAGQKKVGRKRPRAPEVGGESPPAIDDVDPRMRQPSTKISIMLEKLKAMRARDIEGKPKEKCLVFSQWTSMLDIIALHAGEAGFNFCRLDGTMSMLRRKAEVELFRTDPSKTVFLLSMHAAGTGLNLTEANNVILADCWWNGFVEAQCCDRAHRIGQTRPVHVTRFKIKGTCEEKIYEMCARKAETSASALGDSGGKSSGRQKMTLEDAVALFGSEGDSIHIPLGLGADAETRSTMADISTLLQKR